MIQNENFGHKHVSGKLYVSWSLCFIICETFWYCNKYISFLSSVAAKAIQNVSQSFPFWNCGCTGKVDLPVFVVLRQNINQTRPWSWPPVTTLLYQSQISNLSKMTFTRKAERNTINLFTSSIRMCLRTTLPLEKIHSEKKRSNKW